MTIRSADSRLRQSVRRFTLGSGPLKRGSDRVQMVARFVVVLAFLAAPLVAVATATAATSRLDAVAAQEAADRQQTRATVLEDAAFAPRPGSYADGAIGSVPARASWSAPDGSEQAGVVLVRPGTRVGATVPIWVDRNGRLTRAPHDRRGISAAALVIAALPLFGVPVGACLLYAALTAALDAHRQRRWASNWATVAPRWGTRL